jgi:hypothetical protein
VNSTTSNLDTAISRTLATGYLAAGFWLLPKHEWLRAIGLAALIILLASLLTDRLGRGAMARFEPFVVTVASLALLAFPTFPAEGGEGGRSTLYGGVGAQVVVLLWAAGRWCSPGRAVQPSSLGRVLTFAFAAALFISLVATVPILIVAFSGDPRAHHIWGTYVGYFAGAACAGLIYWLMQGVSHLATGRYAIGILAGTCVYGAVAPIVFAIRGDPFVMREALIMAYVCGAVVGGSVALAWG